MMKLQTSWMHFHALNLCICQIRFCRQMSINMVKQIYYVALEDVIFKVEVHIIHGLFLSATHFFKNMSVVEVFAPDRANRTEGIEAAQVQMQLYKDISWARTGSYAIVFLAFYSKDSPGCVAAPLNLPSKV